MAEDLKTLPQKLCDIVVRGIARNFDGSKDSYKTFINMLRNEILDSDFRGKMKIALELENQVKVISMIKENLDSVVEQKVDTPFDDEVPKGEFVKLPPPPRHIYVRMDESNGAILDNIFIESISRYAREKKRKFKFLCYGLHEYEDIEELATELPAYISEGYILVMKGMD